MLNNLTEFESQTFSQGGEDGVLQQIYDCIGTTTKSFVEFGAWNGKHLSNTANLRIHHGWKGLLMEGSSRADGDIVKREFIDAENVERLFEKYDVPEMFDLLSVDIDGNDYWVWKAIERYTPRVVIVEYNITFRFDTARTIEYAANHIWDKSSYHGASLAAFHKLGLQKGYTLVHTDSFAPNAFFVLNSELPADYRPRALSEMAVWDSLVTDPGADDRVWVNV
ncbi:MAG: hypothetical protein ACI9QQ_002260 [Myxococcota bacterium]|jgi:hypothetical protein